MLLQNALYLALMVALGLGIGAIQLIPLFEFVQTNWRSERSDLQTVLGYAHPFRDVLQFVMPNFYGSPAHHSYFDIFTMQTVTDLKNAAGNSINHLEWGMKNYVEGALYVGILPLLLAVYGFLPRPPAGMARHAPATGDGENSSISGLGAYRLIFVSLGVISLMFMFGLPVYSIVYALPGFNQLNSAFRWIYALTVCIAVLAAFGLDRLTKAAAENTVRRVWAYLPLAGGIVVLTGLLLSRVFYAQLEPLIDRVFRGMANAPDAFADARAFYSYEFGNGLIFGVMLMLAGIVFVIFSRLARAQRAAPLQSQFYVAQGFAIVLVIADLWLASWGFNPASDPALLDFTPPAVQFLLNKQAAGEVFRYTTLEDQSQPVVAIMNANSGWRYGLEDIRGYDSIIPRQYVDYMKAMAVQGQLDYNRIAPFFTSDLQPITRDLPGVVNPQSPLLNLLNVRYILTHRSTNLYPEDADDTAWKLIHEDDAVRIWENPAAVPRAYTIANADFDKAWLTPPGEPVDYNALIVPPKYAEATITRTTGREKFVDVTLEADSWLIISENWSNGWRAFVRPQGAGEDAEKAYEVQRILGIFQGVQLPAGSYTVRLVYSPTSFQVGLFGSLISVALVTLMVGMWLWRLFVGENSASSSTTARVARNSIAPIILNLFNRGIDFAFLLVMLRLLSPEEVGTYYYLVVIFVWFDIFTNFGLDLFLIREIARDKAHAGHYFYNITLLRLALCVIGIALLAGYLLVRQATITPTLSDTAILTMALLYAGLFPASLSKGMSSLFYAFEQAEKPAAIATITTINKAIFGVMALLLGYGIVGMAAVSIVNNIITFFVLIFAGRALAGKIIQTRPDMPLLRRMTRDSFPLLLNHFLATIFFQIDVIILEAFKGAVVVAQYSVAYRWILAINVIPSFFTQALLPVMSRQSKDDLPALRRTYSSGIKIMFALAVPLAVAFTFMAEPLTYLMGGSQYLPDGAIAIQLMIWSIPIGWMNSLTQYALVALDLQRRITRAFFVAVTFNIIVNTILIPMYSYPAAAVTTIASELMLFIPFALLMHEGLKQRLPWFDFLWRPVTAGAVMVAVTVVGWQIVPVLPLIAGSIAYIVVLVALRPLNEDEKALLKRMLPERLRSRFGAEN